MPAGKLAGSSRSPVASRLFLFAALLLLTTPARGEEPARGSDAAVREIIHRALDSALEEQVRHLFKIWMQDSVGQPQRAAVGVRRAVAAYRRAIRSIEEERLSWRQNR